MSAISLRIPESLHRKVRELAKREGISINQLIATALAEKIAALTAQEYLEKRASRGSRRAYDGALSKVRDAKPVPGDEVKERKQGK
jgi:hypothetical protein